MGVAYLSSTRRCGLGRGTTLLLLLALLPVAPVQVAGKLQGRWGVITKPLTGELLLTGSLDGSEVGWL